MRSRTLFAVRYIETSTICFAFKEPTGFERKLVKFLVAGFSVSLGNEG